MRVEFFEHLVDLLNPRKRGGRRKIPMIDEQRLVSFSEEAADLLAAMGNQKRMMILCNLAKGEMQVGSLAEKVDLSQSALSQHLAKLRTRQLVKTRREAQAVYYSINSEPVLQMLRTLSNIYCN